MATWLRTKLNEQYSTTITTHQQLWFFFKETGEADRDLRSNGVTWGRLLHDQDAWRSSVNDSEVYLPTRFYCLPSVNIKPFQSVLGVEIPGGNSIPLRFVQGSPQVTPLALSRKNGSD